MEESDIPRALKLIGGLGLGALTGAALGLAFGPAGRRLRGRVVPLLLAAAENPAFQRLVESAAQRAGLKQ